MKFSGEKVVEIYEKIQQKRPIIMTPATSISRFLRNARFSLRIFVLLFLVKCFGRVPNDGGFVDILAGEHSGDGAFVHDHEIGRAHV